jgi:TolB-like protein
MKKRIFFIFLFVIILTSFTTPAFARNLIILVFPFENTGSKEYSWVSAGMTETVISDLTRVEQVSVISNEDRKKIVDETKFTFSGLVEQEAMLKVGKLMGANVLFTGSYLIIGNKIRINARLINVETGKIENSTKLDGTLDALLEIPDRVVLTLLTDAEKVILPLIAPVKIPTSEKQKIIEKHKPKLAAFELYSKGLETQDAKPQEALNYFDKALEIEPNYTNALISAGYTAATLNLEDISYFEKAEKVYKNRNETESPDYAILMMNIGNAYSRKGQFDRALEYYLKSKSIRDRLGLQSTSGYAVLMMNIGNAYNKNGQSDRALEYYEKDRTIEDSLGFQNSEC